MAFWCLLIPLSQGISPLAYVPPIRPMKRSDWPTLGQLIDMGKRVVVFIDYGADGSDGAIVDFLLPEFQMVSRAYMSIHNPYFISHRFLGLGRPVFAY